MQPATPPQRIELTGDVHTLMHPRICACRGAPSCGAFLPVEKVFTRTHTDAPAEYAVARIHVPFCPECVARHHSERPPMDPLKRALLVFRSQHILAAIFPGATAVFLGYLGLKDLLRIEPIGVAVFAGLAAVFTWIAWWGWSAARDATQQRVLRA